MLNTFNNDVMHMHFNSEHARYSVVQNMRKSSCSLGSSGSPQAMPCISLVAIAWS